jgi:hypothetical protein
VSKESKLISEVIVTLKLSLSDLSFLAKLEGTLQLTNLDTRMQLVEANLYTTNEKG